jgi:spore germination protein
MIIYEVQAGDTISTIADKFGVSETRLIQENGITYPNDLVIGQTIVITYPEKEYIVKMGDTLSSIALDHGITMSQLYRNNPYLWERESIYPGDILVISYNTRVSITTNAYAFPFIDSNTLKKSLPYLTYLSILNYKTLRKGEIESFYDDTELIKTTKQFGVAPLMLVTSVTFRGERDPAMIYEILLNPDYQETHAQNMLKVMKEKGYYGLNITITFLNETNEELYLNYLKRLTSILNKEGFPVFITIDPNFMIEDNQTFFEKIDYTAYNKLINEAYLMRFFWGTQYGPPMPVSSIADIKLYLEYIKQMIEPKKLNIGFPLLGYDWRLPYIQGFSEANAITLAAAIDLARYYKSTILFDEISKTPYFEYQVQANKGVDNHVVWFVDARTINEIVNLVIENDLQGTGLWNIMSYYPQFWLVINAQCEIDKLLPEI